jgi:hypothetical protein
MRSPVGPLLGLLDLWGALVHPGAILAAGPITPADFGPDATTLSFDEYAGGYMSRDLECTHGVVLGSTPPIGAELSPDPADWFYAGNSVSLFVAAIVAVPATSTPSPPMKIIATKYGAAGNLELCERCGIIVPFLDPLPREVGLYVTEADARQSVLFSGPTGFLAELSTNGPFLGGPSFVGYAHENGISAVVLRSVPTAGIGLDDLIIGDRRFTTCSAAASCSPGGEGDMNPDGGVDLLDASILRRRLAGIAE